MNIRLNSSISEITRLSKEHAVGLERLSIKTVRDLLFYFPVRYADVREVEATSNLA